MTENATPADSGARRPLHPFFAQNRVSVPAADKPPVDDHRGSDKNAVLPADATSPEKSEDDAAEQPGSRPGRRPGTGRKADQELNDDDLQKKTRPRKRTRNSAGGGIEAHFVRLPKGSENNADKLGHDEDLGPKSSTPKKGAASNPLNHAHNGDRDPPVNSAGANPPTSDQASEPATRLPAVEGSPARPRKLLRFNPKTGTIGSPPKAKKSRANTESETGEGEKRPAQRRSRKSSSKVVRITYGTDIESRARIGKLINAIMSSQTPKPATDHCPGTPKRAASKPSKVLHPFFSGQAKKPDSSPAKVKTIQYTSTPCSPRKQRVGSAAKMPMPQFGVRNLGLKFPGAKLPAWPWKGMVHVRDDGSETACVDDSQLPLPARKSKGNAVKVPLSESIIGLITQSMAIPTLAEAVRNIDTDEITPPPDELRLPEKHFESGSKLQSRISSELRSFQFLPPMKDADQRRGPPRNGKGRFGVPAQLARLFASISTSLSAFDMSRCETANWVQKYAPTSAVEILQPGREVFLLRDWLQALTVQSVDTGSAEPEKSRVGPKIKGPGAGKKKRRKRLDGFIVSSEDEDYELSEVPDESDDWAPSGSRGVLRRTVVRSPNSSKGKGSEKTANALVISGPPGCGKTAAVYAVAKELDFEVFEINPSSRRSGKDVLEKIGDMTRNHHVQQQQSAGAADKPESAAEDGIAKDIKSGKQSTMNTFFKPKSAGTKPKKPAKPSLPQVVQDDVKKEPPKTQKQSLILLEEVDILYEEDKQFWNTVLGLIAQSRRPFIITCNDETLVPLHALRLHGIFRLSTPPTDLAVDRLILIAANEGHALTRQSVEQLYQSRNCDLRAATMDLQYWCQIGVGDRRGGFDWFYPRWPKGIDLDENKETVRVVSQGTYLPGMNLLGRDPILDCKPFPGLIEEEIIHQIWESWGFDIGHWQDSVGLDAWAESLGPLVDAPAERLGALEAYDGLTEAMSAADICSSRLFAVFKEEMVDATQPEPGAQIRDDFVVGLTHLDTPRITYYNSLSLSIASTIRSLAKCSLQLQTEKLQKHAAPSLLPLDESQAIHSLQSSFTSTPPGAPVMNRIDFALAFDPIAAADPSPLQSTSHLEPSVFDRTLKLITLEVAPYVRSIVAYDSRLQKQRLKLSNLVSEGGRGSQGSRRMRTTRSALSALAGGSRSTTRGERWFKADINPYLVAKTAGEGWNCFDSDESGTPEKSTQSTPKSTSKSTPQTSPDTTPTKTPRKVMLKGRKRKRILHDNDDADELGC